MEATTIPGNDLMASDFGDELGDGYDSTNPKICNGTYWCSRGCIDDAKSNS
jgi:hypothetical protein